MRSPLKEPGFSITDHLLGASVILFSLVVFLVSPVRQINDSKYSMLLSESLLRWQSFALDHYAIPVLPPTIVREDYVQDGDIYQLEVLNNHVYYFFPPGTSVLSIPYVAIAKLFGVSAANADGTFNLNGETTIQAGLAALLMSVLAGIFFHMARLSLPTGSSLLISLGGAFGTQVWSTASRAMYADTWALVLLGIALLMIFGQEAGRFRLNAIALATLLSWMYFVSPIYSIHIIAITVYILMFHRKRFPAYAVTGLLWMGGFIIYSKHNFQSLLPHYFMGSRLSTRLFWTALTGNLLSPSRGLLVYVPVVAFILYLLWSYRQHLTRRRLVLLALSVMTAHLLVVSCFAHWWGGHSYGPRFTTGLAPWIVLLAILAIRAMIQGRSKTPVTANRYRAEASCGLLLLAFSTFANARGAISPSGLEWNSRPANVDEHPERVWDWRQPQFLAGLLHPPLPESFPMLNAGERIGFKDKDADKYMWYGWSDPERDFRWSQAKEAAVIFDTEMTGANQLRLRMGAFLFPGRLNEQRILIEMNGVTLPSVTIKDAASTDYLVNIARAALSHKNVLTFRIPDAASPASFGSGNDQRLLGIRVEWMELLPGAGDAS